jgi:DNA-binding response OmpR family regulator
MPVPTMLNTPLNMRELAARVRALIRRQTVAAGKIFRIGDVTLDSNTRTFTRDGQIIHLRPKEFNLLELLMRYPNQVFGNEALLERIWKGADIAAEETVRTHIKTLRRKVDKPGIASLITTVREHGYRIFSAP